MNNPGESRISDETQHPCEAFLGPVRFGTGSAVRIIGILNASPESYYAGSVASGRDAIRRAAERLAAEGADMIDLGAMSTAPYLETRITPQVEADRMGEAILAIRECCNLPITADTTRASVAEVALRAGACAINDVSGLASDVRMGEVIARWAAGVILMANESAQLAEESFPSAVQCVRTLLARANDRAAMAGIPPVCRLLDPGIGFFRHQARPWYEWDLALLRGASELTDLGFPLLYSASRKSLYAELVGSRTPEDRLPASLATAVHLARAGVAALRVHDVRATRDALKMDWLLG